MIRNLRRSFIGVTSARSLKAILNVGAITSVRRPGARVRSDDVPAVLFDEEYYERRIVQDDLPALRLGESLQHHWLREGLSRRIVPTPRFDEYFYLASNPDVIAERVFGFAHFLKHGLREGRRPTLWFDTDWYTADAGLEASEAPYLHYLKNGATEGRLPCREIADWVPDRQQVSLRLYDTLVEATRSWSCLLKDDQLRLLLRLLSLERTTGEPSLERLNAYLRDDFLNGVTPGPLFDAGIYAEQASIAGLPPLGGDVPIMHWLRHGAALGIVPTTRFDKDYYLAANPDVAAGANAAAFTHFLLHGLREGRRPTPWFDPDWYNKQLGSACALPYIHFLSCGVHDGRAPGPLAAAFLARNSDEQFSLELYDQLVGATKSSSSYFNPQSLALLLSLYAPEPRDDSIRPTDRLVAYLRDDLPRGVSPGPLFDGAVYGAHAATAGLPLPDDAIALLHWLRHGVAQRIIPTLRFDEAFYLASNPGVAHESRFGFAHFIEHGLHEGRRPTPWFDPIWYRAQAAGDVGVPYFDFLLRGARQGRLPGPLVAEFVTRHDDSSFSLERYDELVEATRPWISCIDQESIRLLLGLFACEGRGSDGDAPLRRLIAYLRDDVMRGITPGPLFNADTYVERCTVASLPPLGGDVPIMHWLRYGAAQGIIPTARFDPTFYLSKYPDVAAAADSAFGHFVEHGLREGRQPTPWFDPDWYRAEAGAIADVPYIDFLSRGAPQGLLPGALIADFLSRHDNEAFSLEDYDDLLEATQAWASCFDQRSLSLLLSLFARGEPSPQIKRPFRRLIDYLGEEFLRGVTPGPLFDENVYLACADFPSLPPLGSAVPLVHWLRYGAARGIVPTAHFDEKFYCSVYPDVVAAAELAFIHFLTHGLLEARRPTPWFDPAWYQQQLDSALKLPYIHFLTCGAHEARASGPLIAALLARDSNVLFSLDLYAQLVEATRPWSSGLDPRSLALFICLFAPEPRSDSIRLVQPLITYIRADLPRGVSPGPLFDADVYIARAAGARLPALGDALPILHWLRYGVAQRIVPTLRFDEDFYLASNPGIFGEINFGFVHFIEHGLREGRRPTPWFDPAWYRAQADYVMDGPYNDYLLSGARRGRPPGSLIAEFLSRNDDDGFSLDSYDALVEATRHWISHVDQESLELLLLLFVPQWHAEHTRGAHGRLIAYFGSGVLNGVTPGPLFDAEVYTQRAASQSVPAMGTCVALVHWLRHGCKARIVPTTRYEEEFYRRTYFDIGSSTLWGFAHFMRNGAREGRVPSEQTASPRFLRAPQTDAIRQSLPMCYRLWFAHDHPEHAEANERSDKTALGRAEARLSELMNSATFRQLIADAQDLEPAVGDFNSIAHILMEPYHDSLALAHADARKRLPRDVYSSIVCVPWMRMGGADLVAALLARALLRTLPDENVLILRCDQPHFEAAAWLPAGVDVVDISDLRVTLTNAQAELLLNTLFRGISPRRIINVNSRLCWNTFRRYGARLAESIDLYGYFFCWDQSPSGSRVGYPSDFFADTVAFMKAFFTDTIYLKQELARIYALPERIEERLITLFTPAQGPVHTPSAARVAARSARTRSRKRVLWAGRLDRQKRFELVPEIARLMPDVDFECWGAAVLDRAPDLRTLPTNIIVHPPYRTYDELRLTDADAWLFTSAWEGMPTILIELAMWGVAVVASAVGGVPELIRPDTGWPVPATASAQDYALVLGDVLSDPAQAVRRAENLQTHAAQRYNPDNYDRALADVLKLQIALR